MDDKLKVAVLMGGANTERHVSITSGVAVARALREVGHAVAEVDSARPAVDDLDPAEAFTTEEPAGAGATARPLPQVAPPPTWAELAELRLGQDAGVLAPGLLPILAHADVVFLTVFGDEGEAGATQRYLDAHGMVYTGPSAEVCALTFDKEATKRVLVDHGLLTPAWHRVRAGAVTEDLGTLEVPGPWIVKPVEGGSTIGLSFVEERADLPEAVAVASASGCDALVEEFVPGRDVTIAVFGSEVFAVVEAATDRDLYDYTAKYAPGQARKRAPADLTDDQTAEARRLAGEVHRLLEIGDTTSRTDLRLGPDGRFTFFEVNPLPGLTPTSGYLISTRAEGLEFPELCDRIVRCALAR